MISATIEKLIDQVVQDKVNSNDAQSFSAYDITREVRKLTAEIFYHNDAKDYIHAKLQDAQVFTIDRTSLGYILYTKPALIKTNPTVQITMPTLPASAVQSFQKAMRKSLKASLSNPIVANNVTMSVTRTPDARGTISIPNGFVKKVFPNAKAVAVVKSPANNGLALQECKGGPQNQQILTMYTVDRNHNIRITKSILNRAGVKHNMVTLLKDRITVK